MLVVVAILLAVFVLPTTWGVVLVGVALVAEIAELMAWRRFLGRYRVVTGAEGLLGETGEVVEPCRPRGTVRLRGEIWAACAEKHAERGETVVIDRVEGLTLLVSRPGRNAGEDISSPRNGKGAL